jgi:ribulose-phosphate 3-epimerase
MSDIGIFLISFGIGFTSIVVFSLYAGQKEYKKRKDGYRPDDFEHKLAYEYTKSERKHARLIAISLLLLMAIGFLLLLNGRTRLVGQVFIPFVMLVWLAMIKQGNKLRPTIKPVQVVPAILSERLEDYIDQIRQLSKFSGLIHLDIMDGEYVETRSPGALEILQNLKDFPDIKFAVHLMVKNPQRYLEDLKSFKNVALIYVHAETMNAEDFEIVYPFQLGLVFNPDVLVEKYREVLSQVSVVQIMTVFPGKQGTDFIPEALKKVSKLRQLNFEGEFHIDGHINEETIPEIMKFKPDVLNVGSAISKSNQPIKEYFKLLSIANGAIE